MSNSRRFLSELLTITLLVISIPVVFHKVLVTGEPLFGSDFVLQFFPWKKFIFDSLQTRGTLPFWNPYVLCGTPFVGNIQASMFYPLGFLFYLIPADQAYGYTVILHFMLGMVFMYALARSLGIDKGGSSLASIIFIFNGFLLGHLYAGHLTFVQNYIWLPLIFLCLNKFFQAFDFRFAVLGGLCLGIQILGGFPQIAFYTILAIILSALYHLLLSLRPLEKTRVLKICSGTAVVLLAGFCLAAVQLFPTFEFTQMSGRSGGVSYEFATSDSFDPVNFVTFVVPNFFGSAPNRTYWKSEVVWQFWELCAYVGLAPLLLMGFTTEDARARRMRFFFGFLMFLALFLSLGRYNPAYRVIYHLPGFHSFRIPAQILYLYVFSVSILAALGFSANRRVTSSPILYKMIVGAGGLFIAGLAIAFFLFPTLFFEYLFRIVQPSGVKPELLEELRKTIGLGILSATAFFLIAALLIYWRQKTRMGHIRFTVALLLLVMVDLWSFTKPMIRTTNLTTPSEKTKVTDRFANDSDTFRVVTSGAFLKPNAALVHGYQNIEGYDPLILKPYLEYINKSQNTPHFAEAVHIYYVTRLNNNLIRMLNLKYAVEDGGRVLMLKDFLPRVFVVRDAITLPRESILDYMMGPEFDPTREVVLEPGARPIATGRKSEDHFEGSCIISHYDYETIQMQASVNQGSYLFLSEMFYPGWTAEVDGEEVPILRGNYLFRVIRLEKGDHDIKFRFVSWPFLSGLAVSLLTLVACLGFLGWRSRKDPNGTKQ